MVAIGEPPEDGALKELGSEVGTLVAFSLAMFVGAFGAGYVPLCLSLDPKK